MATSRVSFEFFPPKTLDASFRLWETVRALRSLQPKFVSVTYGAGGTTRKLTHEAVTTIAAQYGLNVAAHLTCVDATRAETLEIVQSYAEAGIREIVALRGDPPGGQGKFVANPDGFANSVELVEALAATGKFSLHVGAYPEPHPEAADDKADVEWLKRKFEAGADTGISQFFFEAETFLRFRDACAAVGITKPVIPGILPVEKWQGVRKFALQCGTSVPAWIDEAFTAAEAEGSTAQLGAELSTRLCDQLATEGVTDFHFYTLNRPHPTIQVCEALGITADPALEKVA